MKQLEAGEFPLGKIFSSDFDFTIPDYQRPYAWGTEEALQLLDDLEDAIDRDHDEPYFLGSMVLVQEKGRPYAEVIDGQQRLTTLTILLAVLRDLTDDPALRNDIARRLIEPGDLVTGIEAKPRLTLRKRDSGFFEKQVQQPGHIAALCDLPDQALETDSQHAIRDNAQAFCNRLNKWSNEERSKLLRMTATRTYMVVVSTPDLASAHRIFSVMNARGMDLSPADIFKARVIGEMSDKDKSDYADRWEDAEQDLGRDGFADLFSHIRMIFAKVRVQRELLMEFPLQVLNAYLPKRAKEFMDEVLLPYARSYEQLVNQAYGSGTDIDEKINTWLRRLGELDNNDWHPPALWALRNHGNDPAFVEVFLGKLERLAANMLVRRVYATPRANRYAELLKELDQGDGLDAPAFELGDAEKTEARAVLNGEIYTIKRIRKYLLLRLDETLAGEPGVAYQHKIITVEHVLPQSPPSHSVWMSDFTEDQRAFWTHRLANLVLLNRRKNSAAQNYDFDKKKSSYFGGNQGVATFALTTQVLAAQTWTPDVLDQRQRKLVEALITEWSL
ncbi:DUF262 domain-containing protein [Streptomonospora wellingtoniae]|uniref:DUF262 domain-containing HNH endonuclease family protein n=1 Tax=Streptomonospora wellingtoniae TaxID=3075544 RepID=A0ABU2KN07_9ACTN|nr:DUF262 domain-containing HNH endonuclease family protein [Streptomonospora sp. DSM 45055]MDT0300611.1 DUF262 domain-containing HNH endonuclease family protein [Streptomonospora sp. DSM 45055]